MKFVIVGCGSAKRDRELEPGTLQVKRFPAKDLYTSTYFEKKREYAETVGDQWMILSALHGLMPSGEKIKPYDVTIDDLDDERLRKLAHRVGMTLIEWVEWERQKGNEVEEIVVLAGKRYLDPLREREAFSAGIEPRVVFPLQQNDLGGIGEQMAWLKDRVQAADQQQTQLVTDGGRDLPDPEDDPFACSLCGCYIGQFSGDYCDGCAREIGVKPPLRRCTHCGQRAPEEQMTAIDVSLPDEYYPTFEYLCRGCSGGDQP